MLLLLLYPLVIILTWSRQIDYSRWRACTMPTNIEKLVDTDEHLCITNTSRRMPYAYPILPDTFWYFRLRQQDIPETYIMTKKIKVSDTPPVFPDICQCHIEWVWIWGYAWYVKMEKLLKHRDWRDSLDETIPYLAYFEQSYLVLWYCWT